MSRSEERPWLALRWDCAAEVGPVPTELTAGAVLAGREQSGAAEHTASGAAPSGATVHATSTPHQEVSSDHGYAEIPAAAAASGVAEHTAPAPQGPATAATSGATDECLRKLSIPKDTFCA